MSTWLLLITLAVAGLITPVIAAGEARAEDRWSQVSTARVGWAVRQTTVHFTGRTIRAKALRIHVTAGSIQIQRMTAFGSGGSAHTHRFEPPRILSAGDQSPPISLPAGEPLIERVTLELGLIGASAGTTTFEIWALQSPEAAIATRPMPTAPTRYYKKSARPPAAAGPEGEPVGSGPPPEPAPLRESSRAEPRRVELPPETEPRTRGVRSPPPASAAPPPSSMSPPRPAARPSAPVTTAAPPGPAGDPAKPYAEIDVFFGTDRKREADRTKFDRALATFGNGRARRLTYGKATVTVPKQGREVGSIPRPEWDLVVTRFALRKEDLARDFTIFAVDVLDQAAFAREVRQKLAGSRRFKDQAFVFVHGYFVTFDDALFRAAQIAYDLEFDGVPFVYSWPSAGGFLGYILDRHRARDARDHLRDFMDTIARDTGAREVHLIAHSMGADPLLEVLRDIARVEPAAPGSGRTRFGEIILAAPDVTRESFEDIAQRITGLRRGLTLYASANDKAMRASRFTRLGESPAGHVPRSGPVVIPGAADTIDVTALDTSFFGVNHTTFAERAPLLGDIQRLIQSGSRPPSARAPAFRVVTSPAGSYWRFEVPR